MTSNKSISHKHRNIVSKKPPDMSEITDFNKTTFANLLNMLGQRRSESNHTPRFFTKSAGQSELPKISIGKHAFNLSICLFDPKMINSVLSGFSLSLLVDIHPLPSSRHLFSFSKAADAFLWDKCI